MSQIEVLAIGDVVTDAFIKLLDDRAVVYKNDKGKWLSMPFGTKIPFHHAEVIEAVGNASNASVCFAKLGLKSGLASNVGGDSQGRDILRSLHDKGVDSRFVIVNPNKISNYHYVLWYKEERTILINHEEYDYHWPRFRKIDIPEWVYFSSVSKNAIAKYHTLVANWLDEYRDVKLAFQPGTYQLEAGPKKLKRIYERSEIIIVNREEAVQITGGKHNDLHDLLNRLHSYGPKIAIITDGPAGAYASDGAKRFKMPPYPDPAPPFERTGAGDAFASTLVAALIKGHSLETALTWAPINSMNVVQHTGAQAGLLDESEIKKLLKKAPDWYKPVSF